MQTRGILSREELRRPAGWHRGDAEPFCIERAAASLQRSSAPYIAAAAAVSMRPGQRRIIASPHVATDARTTQCRYRYTDADLKTT